MAVRAVLGTMTYGPNGQTKPEQALEQLLMFTGDAASKVTGGPGIQQPGQVLVDTARGYQGGATEETIGALLAAHPELRSKMSIATKAAPPLDRAAIRAKCEASLAALRTDHVDLYYLHSPDVSVDLDETLSTMNALHKEGKFKEFGLSNYAGWEVVDIWHRCKEKGWVLPTVYLPQSICVASLSRCVPTTVCITYTMSGAGIKACTTASLATARSTSFRRSAGSACAS